MNYSPCLIVIALSMMAGAPSRAQDGPYVPPQGSPEQPVFRCGGGSNATYTHVPCEGGRQIGDRRVSKTYNATPPQDRAKRMTLAGMPPEMRQKCVAMEKDIREHELRRRSAAAGPNAVDEGDLAILRVNYRDSCQRGR